MKKNITLSDLKPAANPTRRGYSERMVEYAAEDKEFFVMESDIGYSTYSHLFGDKYPNRYFNFGIAEVGTMAAAAGVANGGRTVVVGGYGVFLTMRALEVVRSFICYPNLNVKILSSHGGMTPAIDGTTHQATEDLAFMTTIPNMHVLVPADEMAARKMLDLSMKTPGPFFTRLMRDKYMDIYSDDAEFIVGGSHLLREGSDMTIVSYGDIIIQAIEAADELEKAGVSCDVIDMYSIKPWDEEALKKSVAKTGKLVVAENHQKRNGLGYEIAAYLMRNSLQCKFDQVAIEDTFGESGDYYKLIDKYGMSARHIVEKAKALV